MCDTCEPLVTGKSVRRVYRLIDLISSSANDYIKCVFAVAVVLTWSIFPTRGANYRNYPTHKFGCAGRPVMVMRKEPSGGLSEI